MNSSLGAAAVLSLLVCGAPRSEPLPDTFRVAIAQFDAIPEQNERNVREVERLARKAAAQGAEIILFHENCITDYVSDVEKHSELVPDGPSCRRLEALAKELQMYICFGVSEKTRDHFYYITHVFMGPQGFVYKYRKTWICRFRTDDGFRNEWIRYDCGQGPELFDLGGFRATCFICSDGAAPRCLERAARLNPDIVFYPINTANSALKNKKILERAAAVRAPMLVANRIGHSWMWDCQGGCMVIGPDGSILAKTDSVASEQIVFYDLSPKALKGKLE
jgi:predicted amidohydrolase